MLVNLNDYWLYKRIMTMVGLSSNSAQTQKAQDAGNRIEPKELSRRMIKGDLKIIPILEGKSY